MLFSTERDEAFDAMRHEILRLIRELAAPACLLGDVEQFGKRFGRAFGIALPRRV